MHTSRSFVPLAAAFAVTALAACGGGGSTGSALPTTAKPVTATPVAATPVPATPVPSTAPAAAPVGTAQLAGAAGFVTAQSHTIYVFDADLAAPGTSVCSGTCAGVWPIVAASATASYPVPFTAIKRSDGTLQLAYSGRPLYTYVADSAAGMIGGDGLLEFGGLWHIARPAGVVAAASPSPAPSSSPTPVGTY